MQKHHYLYLFILSLALLAQSCSKDNMEPAAPVTYSNIGEGYAAGAATRVELLSARSLQTGYNTIFLRLYDSLSNQPLQNAAVTLVPMMDMGTMKHSCPVENPSWVAKQQLYAGAAVFSMPSGSMGSWTIDILVSVNGRSGKLTLPLTVAEPAVSSLKSFISKTDNAKYFVALLAPASPKVGINDMEIAIYKVKSMMSFPSDSSLTVTVTPEMPTMGHGSPNNVDPAHISGGHYRGKVNFTMTGLWHLNLDFKAGAAVADSTTYFEINF